MQLSVIVITYQRDDALQTCLSSIYHQTGLPRPFEIIVVDNGGMAQIVPPDDGQIKLIVERAPENLGVVGGRRRGCELAGGAALLFIDDDAEWHAEDDMARLLALLHDHPDCGAVAVKSLDGATRQPIRYELPHPDKKRLLEADSPIEVPYFIGVGNALRRTALEAVGGYRAQHFAYSAEDVDLSLRLLDAGWKILYHPQVAVYHHHAQTGRPFMGDSYWIANAVNKTLLAWRLLPMPYPVTTLLAWSFQALRKTRRPKVVYRIWREVWAARKTARQTRQPIKAETVSYIKRIGGRVWY